MRSAAQVNEAAAAQVPTADYIPFGTHVSPNVIKLRSSGAYVMAWRVSGITFETADVDEIVARKEGMHNLIRAIGGGNFSLWTHKLRRRVNERLDGSFSSPFCQDFSDRYYKSFETYKQMATELYVTLVFRPPTQKLVSMFSRMKTRTAEEIKAKEREDLDLLDDVAKQIESSLFRYEPVRLGTYKKGRHLHSELLRFYGYLVNGVWEDVPLRRANIAEYLPTSRLFFGDKNGFLQIRHPASKQDRYVGFLDFQEYPTDSEPGMVNSILYGDYDFIETQSFSILNRRDAKSALEKQKGQLTSSDDAAETEIRQLDQAIEQVSSGIIEMGQYHYTLAIFGDNLNEVSKNMADARTRLQDGPGFKMAVIDAVPECAWFAQLPGNWKMRPREASITSRNFCNLSPLHNFARGKRNGNPWGEALALFKTHSGQPFYFNFHTSPEGKDSTDEKYAGNTSIIGTTGVGKTTLEMTLLAFATKYKGLRAVAFDKDRGMEIGIRAMGGKYFALKRGEPTGFNPFQLEANETNIQFCEKLVKLLVKPEGANPPPLTAKEENDISKAVRTTMSEQIPFENRRLTTVDQLLPNVGENSLRMRLKKWTGNNQLGWVFDCPMDKQDFSGCNLFGYDYTEFLDDAVIRTPMMAYLLHITETLIDGKPFIYFMEEFWKPLLDEYFRDFALNKQKTIRKQFGLGVFVTQSPSDVLSSPIGKTMVEQCVTQIFLPNPRADHDDYVFGFKVTEQEFKIIKNLGENSRAFLVKQGHRSAICKMDLGGMNDILNVISGSLDNVELLDDLRAEVGDDPAVWLPKFHQRIAARRSISK